jgi:phosphoserine phosphatase
VPDARFLVVFDADSTLLRNEVIELIADEAGRGAEVAAATEAAMRGEVDFATSLRSRVAALRGVPLSAFDRVRARVEPTRGGRARRGDPRGGQAAVVSGGFHEILDVVAPLGSTWRANRLASTAACCPASSTARSWMPPASGSTARVGRGIRCSARPHDRRGRRRERPADDGRRRARCRVQREAAVRRQADLVVGPVDLRELIPLLPDPTRARPPVPCRDVGGTAYRQRMDVIMIPGLWLDASSWDDVLPRCERQDCAHAP